MEPVKGGVLSSSETATGHDHLINDLDDVETTGAEAGDGLVFTGDGWVPGAVASSDVANEVEVRTDQPADTVELWVDTDEVAPVAFALGKVVGPVAATFADATTFTTVADVAGLSATWVADPTRLYRTTVIGQTDQVTGAAQQSLYITDGSNAALIAASQAAAVVALTGGFLWWHLPLLESGLSGSVTRKARSLASQSSGRWRVPTYWKLLVEDIGLA